MKTIKLIILFTSIIILNQNAFSQKFGFIGGMNLYKMSVPSSTNSTITETSNKYHLGHHIGVNFSFPLSNNASFEPGFIYTVKGSKLEIQEYYNNGFSSYEYNGKQNVKLHYFEAPLLFKLGFEIGQFKVFGNFGPYVGIGLSGEIKSELNYTSSDPNFTPNNIINIDKINWKWKNSSYSYNRLDIGMAYGIGVSYNSFQLRGLYCDGLTEIVSSSKNQGIRISLVYMLQQKDKEESLPNE